MERRVYEFMSREMNDPIKERKTCARCGSDFAIFQEDLHMLDKLSPVL